MFRERWIVVGLVAALPLPALAANPFADIIKGIKSNLAGTNTVIGTVEVTAPFPGIVTCFKDSPGAAISHRPIGKMSEAEGFPSMIMTRDGVVATGQCSKLQEQGLLKPPVAAAAAGGASPSGLPAIRSTELYGYFEKHPQPGGGRHTDWPRVAVTLLDAPAWGNRKDIKFPEYGCWTFRAKVWESASNSHEVPQFQYCTDPPLKIDHGDAEAAYQVWSGIVGGSSMMNTRGSTGVERTEGPNWPDTPLPVATRAGERFTNPATFDGTILYLLMYDLGIDFRLEDHRAWVNVPDALLNR